VIRHFHIHGAMFPFDLAMEKFRAGWAMGVNSYKCQRLQKVPGD
jgi:hypothetical protein